MSKRAIDFVSEHFGSLSGRLIEVPEWGLVVHASPLTLKERERLYRVGKDDSYHEMMIEALVLKARDSDGQPLFTIEDKPTLRRRAAPDVVERVASEIMAPYISEDDAKKN